MSTQQTNAVAKPPAGAPPANSNLTTVQSLLERFKGQIAVALPKHMTPERMIRVALTAVSQTPKLMECNPYTICGAIVQASILGLEPNSTLGEAFLVPYWNKKANSGRGGYDCQLQVGYKGHVKLARNSGEIAMVDAQPVYENDDFECEKGDTPYLKHRWAKSGSRGKVVGYWAGFKTKDGVFNFEYWTLEQVEEHRDKYTKSRDRNDKIYGPWVDNPDWMCRKTVLIQVLKLAPKSVQVATAIALDEQAGAGVSQRFSLDVPLELQPAHGDDDTQQIEAPQRASQAPPAPTPEPAASGPAPVTQPDPPKTPKFGSWEDAGDAHGGDQVAPEMGLRIQVGNKLYVRETTDQTWTAERK